MSVLAKVLESLVKESSLKASDRDNLKDRLKALTFSKGKLIKVDADVKVLSDGDIVGVGGTAYSSNVQIRFNVSYHFGSVKTSKKMESIVFKMNFVCVSGNKSEEWIELCNAQNMSSGGMFSLKRVGDRLSVEEQIESRSGYGLSWRTVDTYFNVLRRLTMTHGLLFKNESLELK